MSFKVAVVLVYLLIVAEDISPFKGMSILSWPVLMFVCFFGFFVCFVLFSFGSSW